MASVELSYYYGYEAEQFSFYRNKTEYSDTDWSKERIHTEKRIREPALQKGKLTIETEVL